MKEITEVHIVMGGIEYEGDDALKVFTNEVDAEAFVKECEDYDKTKPEHHGLIAFGTMGMMAERRKLRNAFHKELTKWEEAHPAVHYYFDGYTVVTLPLI